MEDPTLKQIINNLKSIRLILQKKFDNPHDNLQLHHVKLSGDVYKFQTGTGCKKATIEQKITILRSINQNLFQFLKDFMRPKISNLPQKNPHAFVQQITLLWSHYQRLIYCYEFIISKIKNFCASFYKIIDNYRLILQQQIIGTVAVMGAYQLSKFIQDYRPLVHNFSKVFCNFVGEERQGKMVPRQNIKDSLAFFQACYLKYQANIQRKDERIILNKKINKDIPTKYRALDQSFFENQFLPQLLASINFYDHFVRIRAPNLTATEELTQMKRILNQQQSRSLQYINNDNNRLTYLKKVDQVLIIQNLQNRIEKADGLKKYLAEFNPLQQGLQGNIIPLQQQLNTFWFIYKRVLQQSLGPIKNIYNEYLKDEGVTAKGKIQKAKQFIQQIIRINKKNNIILDIFDKNFDLKNLEKNTITKMLSNNLIQDKSGKSINFRGAKNLAQFIDGKFKMLYRKSNQLQLQSETLFDITSIFKILTEKDTFLKQHEKTTSVRLTDEVDFSKQDQVHAIINIQQKMIAQIRNQLGFSQIKNLTQNITDLKKSFQETKRVRDTIKKKCHQFNQVFVKTSAFWPEAVTYQIQNPPNVLLPMINSIKQVMSKKGQIKFELSNGISTFKGIYKQTGDQIFQIKNVYLVILLFIDQEDGKKMKFGDLKMKMKNANSQGRKKVRNNQLQRTIIQLLHSGLIKSPNKQIKEGQKDIAKVVQSDQFTLNQQFNFELQQKRQGRPAKMIKKMKIINNLQLTILPRWLQAAFKQQLNEQKLQQEEYQIYKKNKIKGELRKMLKHSHNQQKNCSFDDFMKNCSKIKEYPVNNRFMKEMVEILINEGVCERVQTQRNTYRYIA